MECSCINLEGDYMFKKLLMSVLAGTLISVGLLVPGKVTAAQSWQAYAGAGFGNGQLITMKFYPSTITVDVGDSVTWHAVGDAHTISFLSGAQAPDPHSAQAQQPAGGNTYSGTGFVSSGIEDPGDSYTLTFTKAGTYTYNCLLHPGMSARVVVQPAGAAYPHNQNYYSNLYQIERAQDIGQGVPLLSSILPSRPESNGDGSSTYFVNAGNGNGKESVMRFSHATQMVHVGDTVQWTNKDPMMPHTVTFAGSDGVFTDNFAPVGGHTYDGSSFTSSGILMSGDTYSLRFTQAGHYNYECLLHDEIGMKGTIIVLP
jgi:plastocyanin